MEFFTIDMIINIALVILSAIILAISTFSESLTDVKEIKDKKNKILRIENKGLNLNGKCIKYLLLLSVLLGIAKTFRDDSSKRKNDLVTKGFIDTVGSLNDKLERQFKTDTFVYNHINRSLIKNHLAMDNRFNLIQAAGSSYVSIVNSMYVNANHNRDSRIFTKDLTINQYQHK